MSDNRLRRITDRPQYAHLDEYLIQSVLEEAVLDFEAYTNREDPGARADSCIIELACIKLNMMGAEGSSGASEGDVSRTWDAIPESLKLRMDGFRRPLGYRRTR